MHERFDALAFLVGHLPSFTRFGFDCRRRNWVAGEWSFEGQRWLVTGGSTGIGAAIVEAASAAGATVIAAARSADRLAALAGVTERGGRVEPLVVDLSGLDSVATVRAAVERLGTLDVLVNNVGVLLDEPARSADGLDLAFATNLLVPFVLTESLLESGLLAPNAAVINMSSGGMYSEALSVERLKDEPMPYDGVRAYARHKRAQVALNAYWRRTVGDRDFYVMHPGWADTPGVARSLPTFRLLLGPLLRDAQAGADTALWLAHARPRQPLVEGIWFDRQLWPAHAQRATQAGDDVGQLVSMLNAAAGR